MAEAKLAWSINERTITCVVDGQIYTIQRDHPEARQVLRAIKEKMSAQQVIMLFNKIQAIAKYMCGSVEIRGNSVFCNGEPIHDVIAQRILKFMGDDLPYEPLVKFVERIDANPSKRSKEQLYTFLEHKNLPITPRGTFLAYKAVNSNWTDKHTGKFVNRVGCTLSMSRNKVDDDPDAHCSFGFHVGSIGYVHDFACGYGTRGGDRILIVEVDPADVVSVPRDCSCQKVRTCKYTVVAEYTGVLPDGLVRDSSKPYEDADPEEYEEEDVDWDDDIDNEDEEEADCACDACACEKKSEFDEGFDEGYQAALAAVLKSAKDKKP